MKVILINYLKLIYKNIFNITLLMLKYLKLLDENLQYIALTKNLSHKGKHNYSEVYANSKTQDGAISAYLLSQNIIPPAKDPNPRIKKGICWWLPFLP
jgi:hypothetical protein